jgi:hypothetical protein
LIRAIENSPEAEQREQEVEAERTIVTSVYQLYLGRRADADGFRHYVDALANEMPVAQLIHDIENHEAEQRRQH